MARSFNGTGLLPSKETIGVRFPYGPPKFPTNNMQKIDRQLFETAKNNLQECFDELEAAGGLQEYIFHASAYEKALVKQVFELCEDISTEFGPLPD